MKPTPFDPQTDLPPVPFEARCLRLAAALKQSGLEWNPHVGCFVWDPDRSIPVESPFPERVYFVLNLGRFLQIFESLDAMKQRLVWVPTWFQARLICRRLGIQVVPPPTPASEDAEPEAADELARLYETILTGLREGRPGL